MFKYLLAFLLIATPCLADGLIVPSAVNSVAGKTGNVTLNSSDVGLGNVVNVDTTNAANLSSGIVPEGRLPVGIRTITATGATVNVDLSGVSYIIFNQASASTINTFSNSVAGKFYYFWFQNGNTTVNRNNASLIGGANITFTTGQGALFIGEGSSIRQVTAATVAN
jgi:hypothetical protein